LQFSIRFSIIGKTDLNPLTGSEDLMLRVTYLVVYTGREAGEKEGERPDRVDP
jgi:hypothetical protein